MARIAVKNMQDTNLEALSLWRFFDIKQISFFARDNSATINNNSGHVYHALHLYNLHSVYYLNEA